MLFHEDRHCRDPMSAMVPFFGSLWSPLFHFWNPDGFLGNPLHIVPFLGSLGSLRNSSNCWKATEIITCMDPWATTRFEDSLLHLHVYTWMMLRASSYAQGHVHGSYIFSVEYAYTHVSTRLSTDSKCLWVQVWEKGTDTDVPENVQSTRTEISGVCRRTPPTAREDKETSWGWWKHPYQCSIELELLSTRSFSLLL